MKLATSFSQYASNTEVTLEGLGWWMVYTAIVVRKLLFKSCISDPSYSVDSKLD